MGVKITARGHENIESIIKRFKRACERSDIIKEYKKHKVYEKPSDRRKREKISRKKNYQRYLKELRRTDVDETDNVNCF